MNIKSIYQVCALLVVSIILSPLSAMGDDKNPLTGAYYGTATITTPPNLGTIDLVFYLDVTGTAIQANSSYIVLEKTLLFPPVPPKIGGKDVGPRVSGTASPTSFNLTTKKFTNVVSGKTVFRQIKLSNATLTNSGNSVTGKFTETVTGMGKDPLNITGAFVLVKPVVSGGATVLDIDGNGCIDLNEIRKGGSDVNIIEFSDVSYALYLYYNPQQKLKLGTLSGGVCTAGEQTLKDALNEYYESQKRN